MATDTNIIASAKHYFVNQFKDPEEISVLLKIPQRTIRSWIDKKKWKAERDALINGHKSRIENIRKVISNLTEQALSIQEQRMEAVSIQDKKEIAALDLQAVGIADQIAKWNKALETLDKKGRVNLEVYLYVMDEVFKSLQIFNKDLFLQTIDFQQQHIEHVSNHLG